ncbi:peptidoglycan recognition family protein [Collimonas pratensis]|uniref:N-acetylmuramoyl-L-alanine amidase family protein n=1 Tax=Collimonas pratensis TaxID=279113 RepID=A0ABN4M9Q8_9BURK|nr:peptidoglycan recognition family protein [Collimonas pratensis]AMP14594.1 N-acetylmuramoyl-L-alanine amidase family protein [Collimonas pratensis]
MGTDAHYTPTQWTTAFTESDYICKPFKLVTVNDRAATREAIITRVRQQGMEFVERSSWAAHKNRSEKMKDDWNYTKIAIHHAGRSFSCGPAALQLQEIQGEQMQRISADDIGYHYALDCFGNVFEGRDIRFKGEHVHNYNTGVIGIVLLENLAEPEEGGDTVSAVRKFFSAMGANEQPVVPAAQSESATKFIAILREFFAITTLGGHREFPGQTREGKICPGNVGLSFVKKARAASGLAAP